MAGDLITGVLKTVANGYRQTLQCAVVPPSRSAPEASPPNPPTGSSGPSAGQSQADANYGAIVLSTVLLFIARAMTGRDGSLVDSFLINLGIAAIASVLLFAIPTLVVLFHKPETPNSQGYTRSGELIDRLVAAATFTWIVSLLCLIADHGFYAVSNLQGGLVKLVDSLFSDASHWVLTFVYSAIAGAILLLRSQWVFGMAGRERRRAIGTAFSLVIANAIMMYFLIYWPGAASAP